MWLVLQYVKAPLMNDVTCQAGHAFEAILTEKVNVFCKGTCKDGTTQGATGSGDTTSEATSSADMGIVIICASHGGIDTFDSCTNATSISAAAFI